MRFVREVFSRWATLKPEIKKENYPIKIVFAVALTILIGSMGLVEAAPINNQVQEVVESPLEAPQTDPTEKPVEPEQERTVEEEVLTPPTPPPSAPSSCSSEIKKYDWNQTVAYNVMMVESGNNHSIVNDNPSTGDYSVGCFQINLYGNLKNTRPSEAWLKVPANNVAYAYQMWSSQGWTPWGYTTCRYKVKCY